MPMTVPSTFVGGAGVGSWTMPLVQEDVVDQCHPHVRLLAGTASSGQPCYELIPAAMVEQGVYEVLASPGLTHGCAAGDRIRVRHDGSFEVLRRGGNLCLVLYPPTPPSGDSIAALTTAFTHLDGLVEMPADGRFIVVTVPVAAGFAAVEDAVNSWTAEQDCPWEYGNVYDEDGHPLGWWTTA
ncbi:DUF4265 domain-containing protein [Micromonospora sp. U56]|uniref:DUF4265 domain-containing protein n=1 Tax=Micromonospora sp. U56 TaxID=2824900 RepID=UPI001B35EB60|nr:DUF4265 domain-containing protein [Micromonospora sp. U56]MBQ0895096.1 DUF4265 domain-containing protein [Micromonospora sp. U56]